MTALPQNTPLNSDPTPIAAAPRRAPDSIMAELWAVKARMNAEAGYDVDRLLANVHRMAQQSRNAQATAKLAI
jgi:hypothetical protein